MTALFSLYQRFCAALDRTDWLVPTLARFLFTAVLAVYFLNSGLVKLEDGISNFWSPSAKAYIQIFPKAFDAAGYDAAAMSFYHQVVVSLGTISEFLLPVLIVVGLLTRLAALGMIGFIVVQSLTDIYGHGASSEIGAWFDRLPDAIILDQRALWIFLLVVLVIKGAGPISFDRALQPRAG